MIKVYGPHLYSITLLVYGFIRLIGETFGVSYLLVWEEILLGVLIIGAILILLFTKRTNNHPVTDQWAGFYVWFGIIGVMGVSMIVSPLSIGWSQWAIPIIFLLLMTLLYGIYTHKDQYYQKEVFERKGYFEVRKILARKVLSFSMWFFVILLWLHLGAFGIFSASLLSYEINIFIGIIILIGTFFIAVYPYWEWRMEEKLTAKHTLMDRITPQFKEKAWQFGGWLILGILTFGVILNIFVSG